MLPAAVNVMQRIECLSGRARAGRVLMHIVCLLLVPGLLGVCVAGHANVNLSLSARLDAMNSFSASFEQRLEADTGQILEVSSGVLHVRRPHRFFWQTFEPFPLVVFTDETAIHVYEPDIAQVTERTLDEALHSTPGGIILSGGEQLAERFDISAVRLPEGEGVRYTLMPLGEEAEFLSVELDFDELGLVGLTLEDAIGNTAYVVFSDRSFNEFIADERFEVELPPGVERVSR